jgi:hypothetical protein
VVPADRLARALACPADSATIAFAAVQGAAYETQNRGARPEVIDLIVDRRGPVAVGASIFGCTAREAFERAALTVRVRLDGEARTEHVQLLALDGVWRIVPRSHDEP